jgi:hypothetical protein
MTLSVIISSQYVGVSYVMSWFCFISKWFTANKLVLNRNLESETNVRKVVMNNLSQYPLNVGYDEDCIEESVNTKFLGYQIGNCLNWKNHIHQTTASYLEHIIL